jgi:hypothetical protein
MLLCSCVNKPGCSGQAQVGSLAGTGCSTRHAVLLRTTARCTRPPATSPCGTAGQGATEKKQKKTRTYVLYLARTELLYTYDDVIFFIAFLSSPYRETPQKRNKKKSERGGEIRRTTPQYFFITSLSSPHREALNQRNKKKSKGKKSPPPKKYFPGDFFLKRTQFFSRVFELPLPRNAQKRTKKKKKEGRYVRTFFCELAQMYVVFSGFFFCRPSLPGICDLCPEPEPGAPRPPAQIANTRQSRMGWQICDLCRGAARGSGPGLQKSCLSCLPTGSHTS